MSDAIKEILIERVRAVPAIWDRNHKQHHDRYTLAKHWKKITLEVGLRENEAKKLWRNLRQEFGKQIKRVWKSGLQTPDTANPQWPFYHSLLFLKDQFTPDMPGNATEAGMADNFEFAYDYNETDSMSNLSPSPSPGMEDGPGPSQFDDNDAYLRYRRTMPQTDVSRALLQLEKEKLEMQRQHQNTANATDEDMGFFHSLLPYVRQLVPQQKMLFRMQVQQQLYEFLYGPNDSH